MAHDVLPVAMFPLLYTDLFWHSANLIYSSAKRSCDITCIEIELCIWTWCSVRHKSKPLGDIAGIVLQMAFGKFSEYVDFTVFMSHLLKIELE